MAEVSSAEELGLLRLGPSHAVNIVSTEADIKEKCKELFNGVGLLRDYDYELNIDDSVKSVAQRTSFPCRYSDMIYRFGRPVPVLSMITNQVVDYIYQAHGHRLTQWNNLLLNPAALQRYADAIARKGAPLENCFGFVDGTVRPICRPNENQSTVYNGHKRVHALKFQSVTIPNGLIANLYGPVGIKVGTCIYLLIFFHHIYHRVVLCT